MFYTAVGVTHSNTSVRDAGSSASEQGPANEPRVHFIRSGQGSAYSNVIHVRNEVAAELQDFITSVCV